MQAAADSAALASVHHASAMTAGELKAFARKQFDASFNNIGVALTDFNAQTEGTSVVVTAGGQLGTSLMAVVPGFSMLPIKANSRAAWRSASIDIALVLDITRSMEGSRMDEMKAAVLAMLDALEAASTSGNVRVSLVTFNSQVKIDPSLYRNAPWLRFEGVTQAAWNGCLNERDVPYNYNSAPHNGSVPTKYYAEPCQVGIFPDDPTGSYDNDNWMEPILILSDDFDLLRSRVSSLIPSNNTNITIGAAWGLATLTPDHPINSTISFDTSSQKIMVLLSDGHNTESRFVDPFTTAGKATADKYTSDLCQKIRSNGIQLHTIRFIEGSEALMSACASDPSMYYNVTNVSNIDSAFMSIVRNIMHLRLTH